MEKAWADCARAVFLLPFEQQQLLLSQSGAEAVAAAALSAQKGLTALEEVESLHSLTLGPSVGGLVPLLKASLLRRRSEVWGQSHDF